MDIKLLNEAVEFLNKGNTPKDLISKYKVSQDQAKKVSQVSKMRRYINSLDAPLQRKFIDLGFKVLVLSSLFKEKDIDGLKEILESIDVNIKRDDLRIMPEALKIKRENLENSKKYAAEMMKSLENIQVETEEKIKDLELNKLKIDESIKFLSDVEDIKAKNFLMDHLGVTKGTIVLYKRLDISWQQSLKNKTVIEYNESTYTWEIKNLNEFKRQVEKRIKKNNNMYYDPDKATGFYASYYPTDPVYKNASGLISSSISESIIECEKQLRLLKIRKREVTKKLKDLKSTTVQSYVESAEVSNVISQHDILAHRKLQNSGMRYLYNNDYVAAAEVSKDNFRFDVIGYNSLNDLIIIEAKASIGDFRSDYKFHRYINYCNKMYFIFPEDIFRRYEFEIINKLKPHKIGILIESKGNVIIKTESGSWNMSMDDKDLVTFNINRILSRKFIYGR